MEFDDEAFQADLMRADWPETYEGTVGDVRVVVASMPLEVGDGFVYDRVPWGRFSHAYGPGADVPELLERLRSADARTAEEALSSLWGSICHQGTRCSVAPLAVPFLLRIAADRSTHHRDHVLWLAATVARREYWGHWIREGLLRVADADDDVSVDMKGYPQNWTVRAARDAIAADAHVVIALLDDPDLEVREAAGYALAASTSRAGEISAALRARLCVEKVPRVRAGLVLAIAQLAREHRHEDAAAWTRALWSDPTRPAEVVVSAALGWLCLVDDPVPDELRAVLDESVTHEHARLMALVPWVRMMDHTDDGPAHILRRMLDPNACPPPVLPDPWPDPETRKGCADDPPF
ncbi:hypothetical protein [Embleya sp. NPDC005971]|uniref:hypothetical protein n=1 Tax=Embleya sp. NPDC005971 TaxID=3156724 RepID=UPI00340BB761